MGPGILVGVLLTEDRRQVLGNCRVIVRKYITHSWARYRSQKSARGVRTEFQHKRVLTGNPNIIGLGEKTMALFCSRSWVALGHSSGPASPGGAWRHVARLVFAGEVVAESKLHLPSVSKQSFEGKNTSWLFSFPKRLGFTMC